MITHVIGNYISFMRNQSLWTCSKCSELKLKFNSVRKIKCVRSDRGGEYYGKYDGSREQRLGSFADFLKECEIVS